MLQQKICGVIYTAESEYVIEIHYDHSYNQGSGTFNITFFFCFKIKSNIEKIYFVLQ